MTDYVKRNNKIYVPLAIVITGMAAGYPFLSNYHQTVGRAEAEKSAVIEELRGMRSELGKHAEAQHRISVEHSAMKADLKSHDHRIMRLEDRMQ